MKNPNNNPSPNGDMKVAERLADVKGSSSPADSCTKLDGDWSKPPCVPDGRGR